MPRFICKHPTTSLIKHITPSGQVLAFGYRGVLDTDEEGATVIRANPLYGRLILEGDESALAREEVPALETSPAVVRKRPARRPARPWTDPHRVKVECLVCGRQFVQNSWSPRLYCDAKCRARAYRVRRDARPRLIDYERHDHRLERGLKCVNPLKKRPKPLFRSIVSRTKTR